MKLLIITQKVDVNDPILGFFHRWIIEFAKHAEKITVICLEKREYDLPSNVKVLSLGKETGQSRLKYIWRFYKYIWQERKKYDKVFVHMNQEYVLLAGWWWVLVRKPIYLWRNHPSGSWLTNIAVILSKTVFCTSPEAYTARFTKTKLMPVGIDIENFHRIDSEPKEYDVIYLGRISSIKKVDLLIEALNKVVEKNFFNLKSIVVGDGTDREPEYYQKVRTLGSELERKEFLYFKTGVTNKEVPAWMSKASVLINITPTGSMDKVILEAMACESLVLVSNKSFLDILPPAWAQLMVFKEYEVDDLVNKLNVLLSLSTEDKEKIGRANRQIVEDNHSLKKLSESLFAVL